MDIIMKLTFRHLLSNGKTVGMTEGGLRKMIFLETFLYGFRALAWGIPISLLLSVVMYRTLGSASAAFEVDVWMYLLASAAVFGIVGISMLLGTSKVKQDSIIEVLKEDIT